MQKAKQAKSPAVGAKRKLTRAEKKQIAEVIQKAKGDGKPHSAQQTIPYVQMFPDGICHVSGKRYSKTVAFEDINYQLAQADEKTAIFENWCDFLNYFDASVQVQLSFINQGGRGEEAQNAIQIPAQEDAFNSIRIEYGDMLKNQLAKGNNGLVKSKYITFSIEADNLSAAKARLARIETDILNNFKVLGVTARPMTGYERLEMLHGIFHPEGEPFRFSWDWLIPSGLTTKLEVVNDSQIFEQGGVVLELCSSWELPIEDGDWFSLMGGTYVVKMSEMIVVSMVDKFRFVHDCGNWVISGCRVAVILCNWELSRENTGMRQLYVWRDFFVEGKFHKKVKQWVMSIPEDANELSKNCWSYFDYPVEQSEIEEYVESSDDDYSVKCSVYEFFGGKKLVRISKLTVPRAETAVELDVYGVFGILRGNSVADQDDFIRETDFCGH